MKKKTKLKWMIKLILAIAVILPSSGSLIELADAAPAHDENSARPPHGTGSTGCACH
tara:strand:- start:245 stop:415 length:171 start_codon:yes stop_codon:yes gene_type:complete